MNVEYLVPIILEDILEFHADLEKSDIPVENGVRDMALLEAAVNSPFQTFGGEDLFPTICEKAARLCYGIANNHAFVDGNKRTAVHAMEAFLIVNQMPLECSDDEMEQVIIKVADGQMSHEDLAKWIKEHS